MQKLITYSLFIFFLLTGILIFKDNQFTQILEGEESSVEKIWLTIQKDERHKDLQLLAKDLIQAKGEGKGSH